VKNVFLVMGTRPEAIKMAPVYRALKKTPGLSITVISTGQHRELLAQAMQAFDMSPDIDLQVMRPGQSLSALTCSILEGLEKTFERHRPDLVLAHGDTTTCFSAALSCFYHRIPIAHVEAGLRTYRIDSPFPEEFNRQGVAKLAGFHFAPDAQAKDNLLREGVSPIDVCVTGSTAVDAIDAISEIRRPSKSHCDLSADKPVSVITLHRRENGSETLKGMLTGIKNAARLHPEMTFVYPMHPNPSVRRTVLEVLSTIPNLVLREPMEYRDFIGLMARATVVITDSGGIQEEADYLRKRVLLLREHTERVNGLGEGRTCIVGTNSEAITAAISRSLTSHLEAPSDAVPHESPSLKIAREIVKRLA